MIEFTRHPQSVEFGSEAHRDLLKATSIDLSSPTAVNTFYALVLPGNGNTYAVAKVLADTPELIGMCQESISDVLSAANQQMVTLPISGEFDCDTAKLMLAVAELMGQDVEDSAQWSIGPKEFVYLLGQSRRFQKQATEAMQILLPWPLNGLLPMTALDGSYGFFAAPVTASVCSPEHLHLAELEEPSTGLDTTSYLEGSGSSSDASKGSSFGFVGGLFVGLALAVGSTVAYEYSKGIGS